MTTHIDGAKALALLEEVVADPTAERATSACTYITSDGEHPNCIVGHALYRVGVPLRTLRLMDVWGDVDAIDDPERQDGMGIDADAATRILAAQGVELNDAGMRVLKEAQFLQDAGASWGSAVENARRVAAELAAITADMEGEL